MQEPYAHTMMPQASHDEVAREQFVATFKMHMEDNVYPADETVYRQRAEPEFARTNNRSPETRQEVRRLMEADPFFQMWSSVARNLQEMLWYNVGECVERQLPELIEKARTQTKNGRGSLTLDPGLEIPRYNASIDIHCMPGGYHSEITDKDDVFAGALYDRGAYYYVMGLLGGRGNEMTDAPESFLMERAGHNIVDYLRAEFPDLKVRRVLDMGCTIGSSTRPYAVAFPDAEIHAIDIAAPVLRYGHARAEALGYEIHFSQQNAESTNFPDGHFDLVVSSGMAHETSAKAIRNILAECHRLLRPGGVTIHSDPQFSRGLTPHDSFMHDWDTFHNAEPFWGTLHDTEVSDLMTGAGFPLASVREIWAQFDEEAGIVFEPANDHTSGLLRSTLFGAKK